MELTTGQWIEVDTNARQAVRATQSYWLALKYADQKSKLLNWDPDVFEMTLKAITTMYERGGDLTKGKAFNPKPSQAGGDF